MIMFVCRKVDTSRLKKDIAECLSILPTFDSLDNMALLSSSCVRLIVSFIYSSNDQNRSKSLQELLFLKGTLYQLRFHCVKSLIAVI